MKEIKERLKSVLTIAQMVSEVANEENDGEKNGYDVRIVSIYPKGKDYDDKENTQVFTVRLHMPEKKIEIFSRLDSKVATFQLNEDDDIVECLSASIAAVMASFKHFDDLDMDDLTFKWLGD